MWDEKCRFTLFCAWRGTQWRKCYFNHLTETVLAGFCRFNEFLQWECSLKHVFLNPDFASPESFSSGDCQRENETFSWHLSVKRCGTSVNGSFAILLFYRLPRRLVSVSEWICFPAKQDVWEIVYLPTSNACCIIAVDIACSKWVGYRGTIDYLLAFLL